MIFRSMNIDIAILICRPDLVHLLVVAGWCGAMCFGSERIYERVWSVFRWGWKHRLHRWYSRWGWVREVSWSTARVQLFTNLLCHIPANRLSSFPLNYIILLLIGEIMLLSLLIHKYKIKTDGSKLLYLILFFFQNTLWVIMKFK